MAAAQSCSLTSVKDYAVDVAAKSDARFRRTIFQLLFDQRSWNFSLPPFKEKAGCLTLGKKDGPYSHQAGALQDRVSRTPLHVLQPSFLKFFVKKTLDFKGTERTSQRFCARCPYVRVE